jgi:hypothetical protein
LGTLQREAISLSCFLSTSSIDFSAQVAQWQPSLDTTYSYGHSLQESFQINAKWDVYDRIVFQFSQGAPLNAFTALAVEKCYRPTFKLTFCPCPAFLVYFQEPMHIHWSSKVRTKLAPAGGCLDAVKILPCIMFVSWLPQIRFRFSVIADPYD